MAYLVNSIGGNVFILLSGEAQGVQSISELIMRPNVAEVSTRIFSAKGVPFQLVSLDSATNEITAQTLYHTYLTSINAGLVGLIKDGLDYNATYSVQHKVLNVELLEIKANIVRSGNIGASDTALISCRWELIGKSV